jgi:hypothetical protein
LPLCANRFGVIWPHNFAETLSYLLFLSLDFGVLGGVFCVVDVGFYDGLLAKTVPLILLVSILQARIDSDLYTDTDYCVLPLSALGS